MRKERNIDAFIPGENHSGPGHTLAVWKSLTIRGATDRCAIDGTAGRSSPGFDRSSLAVIATHARAPLFGTLHLTEFIPIL